MIEVVAWGEFDENTYIAGDERECIVFDPGAPFEILKNSIAGRKIVAILTTHTHLDHILGVDELRDATGAAAYAPIGEAKGFEDPSVNLSSLFGLDIRRRPADGFARPGDAFTAGSVAFTARFTPGHSPGHLSWVASGPGLSPGFVVAGDALFAGSIGRTDLPGQSHDRLIQAVRAELMTLPDETIVYPGHGPKTTIGTERRFNPFLS
jgi:glyoxylase-like metal-dependent hydrolase (beta-lactamase superfamily II)